MGMRLVLFALLCISFVSFAQPSVQPDAALLKLKIRKLNFLGSVLYMAAHPDDENTKIITCLSKQHLATTGYLSITRGDGGQNLIGTEIRDQLGLIRTQELLAARRIDGGQQFFTRANDFGFSKSADETFKIWGKDNVLSDAVKIIRQYQPDVIITRFPPDARAGHGHHTASAIIAQEAFDVAAKKDVYVDQVKELGTWQVKRLYTNTGRWWNKDINERTPGVITVDVGGYNTLLGKSYSEIAALSSSQHKSQGWGSKGVRGYLPEFLEYVKGEPAKNDIFEGVNTSWTRVKDGEKVQLLIERVIREFNAENPAASVPLLLQVRKQISALDNGVWKSRKLQETEQCIQECLGLFIETTAAHYQASPGASIHSSIEIINRSTIDVVINEISSHALYWDTIFSAPLKSNVGVLIKGNQTLSEEVGYSDPYWLQKPHDLGLFTVDNSEQIGLPQNLPAVEFIFSLTIAGEKFQLKKPLFYKWTNPVKGELWRPFEVVPPIVVNVVDKVLIFKDTQPKDVRLLLRSVDEKKQHANLRLQLPEGWRSEPASIPFELNKRGEELSKSFKIYPSSTEMTGVIQAVVETDGKKLDKAIQYIDYDHIPLQTLLPKAEVKIVRIDLKKEGALIGYVKGAGDEIPSALRNMGYDVWEMKEEEVTTENLKRVDAVVLGVRLLNTSARVRYYMTELLEYVKNGGTLVVQYNTSFDLELETFSPYSIKLGRERVTEEDSNVRILKPDHPIFNSPNKITQRDFEGWIQERGLYFPSQWDVNFEPMLSMNDTGETAKEGSLLVARYGKGYYLYTGLSFFRELPEGVPGAYKLFANLISLGKTEATPSSKSRNKTK
jgi:LmbE family N-acetylglucosaminyl deacetylase